MNWTPDIVILDSLLSALYPNLTPQYKNNTLILQFKIYLIKILVWTRMKPGFVINNMIMLLVWPFNQFWNIGLFCFGF